MKSHGQGKPKEQNQIHKGSELQEHWRLFEQGAGGLTARCTALAAHWDVLCSSSALCCMGWDDRQPLQVLPWGQDIFQAVQDPK